MLHVLRIKLVSSNHLNTECPSYQPPWFHLYIIPQWDVIPEHFCPPLCLILSLYPDWQHPSVTGSSTFKGLLQISQCFVFRFLILFVFTLFNWFIFIKYITIKQKFCVCYGTSAGNSQKGQKMNIAAIVSPVIFHIMSFWGLPGCDGAKSVRMWHRLLH